MSQTEPSVTANQTAGEAAAKLAAIGEAALDEGDFVEAISCFRQALRAAPGAIGIMRNLGEALAASGDLAGAEGVFAEAVGQAPDDAAALVDLAHVRQMRGDRAGAREAIERAVAQTADPALRLDQARLYESLGEPRLAAATFAEVARAAPAPGVFNDLARLSLELGQYADADAAFRRLGGLDTEHELVALVEVDPVAVGRHLAVLELNLDRGDGGGGGRRHCVGGSGGRRRCGSDGRGSGRRAGRPGRARGRLNAAPGE